MIYSICYTAIFIAEIFISFLFFETKFERKVSKGFLGAVLVGAYLVLYCSRLLNLPWLNLLCFLVCNFLILFLCYKPSIKSCIFHPFMLLILMTITEIITIFSFSSAFGVSLLACLDNSTNLIIQSILCKTLYLVTVYLILKISTKEQNYENNKMSWSLFILPVSSIALIYVFLWSVLEYKLEQQYLSLMLLCFILLFVSNIIVFTVYEFNLKIHRRNLELEIEHHKESTTAEYYELLNQQNESTKIFIHDIKRHLNTIKSLAPKNDNAINSYIDSIIGEFGINNPIDYCNNALVNVITNRYKRICESSGIKFNIDIRNTQIDFMSEPDITALLDNLLENAIEATDKTSDKFIDFIITTNSDKLLTISIANSVAERVNVTNNNILSSKKSSGIHGVGLKSIKRVVHKYDGEIDMSFDEKDMIFTTTVVFQLL